MPPAPGLAQAKDLPELTVDVGDSKPWQMTDSALVAALAKVSGRAFVALKAPGSLPVAATVRTEAVSGAPATVDRATRAAVPKADVDSGLAAITSLGATVIRLFENSGLVEIEVDPAKAPVLRSDPHLDFLEPDDKTFTLLDAGTPPLNRTNRTEAVRWAWPRSPPRTSIPSRSLAVQHRVRRSVVDR